MSMQTLFNEDQWFLLGAMPGLVGAAMSNAAPSGIVGTIKEMGAAMHATTQGTHDFPDSELIRELTQKAANWDEAKNKIDGYKDLTKARLQSVDVNTHGALQTMSLEDCESALKLVDEYCPEKEATAYREWTLHIATEVAKAAKEGSILGFGGERISEQERLFLNRLENTLGLKNGVLIA